MGGSCFAERLQRYLPLTAGETEALSRLEAQERKYRRGTVIRRENERADDIYVVRSGWTFSSVILDDGSRQILRLNLPGDLIGMSSLAFAEATDSLTALTDVVLCPFGKGDLKLLFDAHPRLAGLMLTVCHAERVALTDRLASLGRTSAKARVAALLLDSLTRLRVTDSDLGARFGFPLTQEEIGDATGLTAVHVNRMMRALVEDGLIARSNGHEITLLDEPRLSRIANFADRYSEIDTSWLSRPR